MLLCLLLFLVVVVVTTRRTREIFKINRSIERVDYIGGLPRRANFIIVSYSISSLELVDDFCNTRITLTVSFRKRDTTENIVFEP